jgi:predicted phosphoribosyltransferase
VASQGGRNTQGRPDRNFGDRKQAGQVLARLLEGYRGRSDVVVLALPRGGVPVASEVAAALGAPLDVFIVRKLGVPGHRELAMGALAEADTVVLNDEVVRHLDIPRHVLQDVIAEERLELLRQGRTLREGRVPIELVGMVAVLVDDGLATGSSMRAAMVAVRQRHPARIVVAVPVAPHSTAAELAREVDEVVCATTPSPFLAVGESYRAFPQVTDEEVKALLRAAALREQPG